MIVRPKYRGPDLPTTLAVSMTAAASGSSGITVADDDDIDFGTGNFTIHWEGALPDWSPSSISYAAYKIFSNVGYIFSVQTDGTLRARINATNYISTASNAIIDTANAKLTAVITRESASVAGSVVFYANGSQLGASVAITAASPSTTSNSANLAISGTDSLGGVRNASTTRACYLYNRALSAAEVLSLCNNGVATADVGASQAEKLTNGDFSAGSTGWTLSGQDATHILTFSGGTLRYQSDTLSPLLSLSQTGKLTIGKRYRVTAVTSSFTSGSLKTDTFTTAGLIISSGLGTVTFEGVATSQTFQIIRNSTNVDITLDSVSVVQIGCTLQLDPTGLTASGLTWTDSSGNGNNGTLPASGATKVTIRK